jgi:hypothetical protein
MSERDTSESVGRVVRGRPLFSETIIHMDHRAMAHHVGPARPDRLHPLVTEAGADMGGKTVADAGLAALFGKAGLAAGAGALQGEEELGIGAEEPVSCLVEIDADAKFGAQAPAGLGAAVDEALFKPQAVAEDAVLGHHLQQQSRLVAAAIVHAAFDGAFDGDMPGYLLAGPQAGKMCRADHLPLKTAQLEQLVCAKSP